MMLTKCRRRCSAFTLIELMVVIAIIGILAGIVLAVGWKSVQRARAVSCMNKMRQIGMSKLNPEGAALVESSEEMWECPEGGTYAFSKYAEDLRGIADPAGTVLLYESKGYGTGDEQDVDLRHSGAANFVFCDGHAQFRKSIPPFKP